MMEELKIPVKGMGCGACVAKVESAVKPLPGVKSVKVDLKGAEATVNVDTSLTSAETIRKKINEAGFEAGACGPKANEEKKGGLFKKLRGN